LIPLRQQSGTGDVCQLENPILTEGPRALDGVLLKHEAKRSTVNAS
jgi:hypothetical protein